MPQALRRTRPLVPGSKVLSGKVLVNLQAHPRLTGQAMQQFHVIADDLPMTVFERPWQGVFCIAWKGTYRRAIIGLPYHNHKVRRYQIEKDQGLTSAVRIEGME